MIVSFADAGTEDLFHGRDTGPARRTCPGVEAVARRKLDQLNQAENIRDMAAPPGNRAREAERGPGRPMVCTDQ